MKIGIKCICGVDFEVKGLSSECSLAHILFMEKHQECVRGGLDQILATMWKENRSELRKAMEAETEIEAGVLVTGRLCPDCEKEHSASCPLRVWGRNERNEGKTIGTRPADYCSHFVRKD